MGRTALETRWLAVASLVVLSCARFGYESLPGGLVDLGSNAGDDTGSSSDGNTTDSGGAAGSAGASADAAGSAGVGSSTGSGGGAGGASSDVDAGNSTGGDGLDAGASGSTAEAGGAPASICEPAVPTATWAFPSNAEGWQYSMDTGATANLGWTAVSGDPAPGALQLDVTVSDQGVRSFVEQNFGDLSAKVIYARVFLESGSGITAKVFVQMGAGYSWADGYEVTLQAQQWNCLAFDVLAPDYSDPGFDPTDVRRIGVLIFGSGSSRLYIDQVTY